MKILRFKTFDFQEFKNRYAARCKEKRDTRAVWEKNLERDFTGDFVQNGWALPEVLEKIPVLTEEDAPVVRKAIRLTQSETRLMEKATYLMDVIIYRAATNAQDDPKLPLMTAMNASLMKEMLGRDYKPALEAFIDLKYIRKARSHDIGEAALYEVIDGIEEIDCPREIERKVKEYRERTEERLTKVRDEEMVKTLTRLRKIDDPKATDVSSAKFIKHYIKGLNKIRIADEEGLNKAIPELKARAEKELNAQGKPKDPESIKIYYDAIERTLREEKDIYDTDAQGRMYHFLTGLKRELKEYLSISFSLDCKNSHPVLFNYILFKRHNIDVPTRYKVSLLLHQLFSSFDFVKEKHKKYHYVGKSIRKYLIDKGIKEDALAGFGDDELKYIYETTNGIFWDNICEKHPEFDRSDIKKRMFGEVFYSNIDRMVYKRDGERIVKEYGKVFRRRYPNVYKEIARWKHPEKHPDIQRYMDDNGIIARKTTASLPIALMSRESRIFRSVLEALYRKRYYAVHIHDCIVIPETGNTHQPTREEVERLLMKEYAKIGLVPTLKAE